MEREGGGRDAIATLAYDDVCNNCVRFKRMVEAVDRGRMMRYVSLRDAEGRGLLDSVPNELRYASFHLVAPDGIVESGSAAIPTLFGLLVRHKRAGAIGSLPGAMSFLTRLYSAASTLHQTGSCRRGSKIPSDPDPNRVL